MFKVNWRDALALINFHADPRRGFRPGRVRPRAGGVRRRIDELYTAHPFYGSRKIAFLLQINRKAAQLLMREMGLAGLCPGPNLSRRDHQHRVYPYTCTCVPVQVSFAAFGDHPPQPRVGIAITCVRLRAGWLYLVAVLDRHSRYVVSWELDAVPEQPFVLRCAQRALAQATPVIRLTPP